LVLEENRERERENIVDYYDEVEINNVLLGTLIKFRGKAIYEDYEQFVMILNIKIISDDLNLSNHACIMVYNLNTNEKIPNYWLKGVVFKMYNEVIKQTTYKSSQPPKWHRYNEDYEFLVVVASYKEQEQEKEKIATRKKKSLDSGTQVC